MKNPVVLWALVILAAVLSTVNAKSVSGNRVLVLLDSIANKDTYSHLWQSLQDREYKITFATEEEQDASALQRYGEFLYDHVIHFAPESKELSKHKAFGNVELVKFVRNGGNLLVATGENPSNGVRELAGEFDIEFDAAGTRVYNGDETTIYTSQAPMQSLESPVLYSGIALYTGKSPLLNRLLLSEPGVISADKPENDQSSEPVELVAAMQTRNSARATFAGSLALFSDDLVDASFEEKRPNGSATRKRTSSNAAFVEDLTKWTFQEKGVLKILSHRHHKVNETEQPKHYRIKDDMVYILEVSEYKDDKWVPFEADDIQLEIIMLDPYIRTTLKQVPVSPEHHYGRFTAHVKLPDVYGVFTFKVNYKRAGLTYLLAEDVVAIRPFRHNEYPRYLSAAYPYYASVGSMIVGFLVFSAVWLSTWGSRNQQAKQQKQKAQ
ncbi:Dolichyl-diphosphooligosaccharide--protein glycosyltransferase subunit WBP1 [Syncephalastrum racemosum]|uniref:Dolichyl-diphosphooligosaccharide--protein glycosyltransferase subunit WBP1 n=1 Tax=Syncephalastrum racemosum TaxID=13706 RepID=A0A1X2H5Y9_SYNRA|nr:Dolichyl-diphosphooligosaccharide--protein glycosyltransferase subunit WBP1 [Syncephalastrum racemosum]